MAFRLLRASFSLPKENISVICVSYIYVSDETIVRTISLAALAN